MVPNVKVCDKKNRFNRVELFSLFKSFVYFVRSDCVSIVDDDEDFIKR